MIAKCPFDGGAITKNEIEGGISCDTCGYVPPSHCSVGIPYTSGFHSSRMLTTEERLEINNALCSRLDSVKELEEQVKLAVEVSNIQSRKKRITELAFRRAMEAHVGHAAEQFMDVFIDRARDEIENGATPHEPQDIVGELRKQNALLTKEVERLRKWYHPPKTIQGRCSSQCPYSDLEGLCNLEMCAEYDTPHPDCIAAKEAEHELDND